MQRTGLAITTFFSAEERATIFACAARVLSLAIPPALNPTDNVKYAMSTVPRSLARQVQFARYPIASTSVPFFHKPPKGQDSAKSGRPFGAPFKRWQKVVRLRQVSTAAKISDLSGPGEPFRT